MRIRDIANARDVDDVITETTWGGVAWSLDNEWVFYVTPDEAMRPWRVWRHKLGTAQSADVLVFEEPDERFFISVSSISVPNPFLSNSNILLVSSKDG